MDFKRSLFTGLLSKFFSKVLKDKCYFIHKKVREKHIKSSYLTCQGGKRSVFKDYRIILLKERFYYETNILPPLNPF